MPMQLSGATTAACSRCAAPLGGERRRATGLAGEPVCEPCQHEELEELLRQLDLLPPGPAVPANTIPLVGRERWAGQIASERREPEARAG